MANELTVAELLQIESLCDQFERALQDGEVVSAREFVCDGSDRMREALIVALLRIEWDYQRQRGIEPQGDQVAERFPEWAEPLRAALDSWCRTDVTAVPSLESCRSIGPFELLEQLGWGAFGSVWRATDTRSGALVALKVSHAGIPEESSRFLREARVCAQLDHPHIVRVFEGGIWDGRCCIVRQYVVGESLADWLRCQRPSPREAAQMCYVLANALTYSHSLGCVHRDIKPQNILIDASGQPLLTDFGLAKFRSRHSTMTLAGTVVGTPAYMAPEQAKGQSHLADARSDIYSLGIVLYQLLTRRVPFEGTAHAVLWQVMYQEPLAPTVVDGRVPGDLERICLRCLQKEPGYRYSSARELAQDLKRYLTGQPVSARPLTHLQRVVRWARRYPVTAVLSSGLMSLLIVMLVALTRLSWNLRESLVRERTMRQAAESAESAARAAMHSESIESDTARRATQLMEDIFTAADPLGAMLTGTTIRLDPNTRVRDMVDNASRRLDRELVQQPRVQARLLDSIAGVYRSLGEYTEARARLDQAAGIRAELLRVTPTLELGHDQARHLFQRAWLEQSLGNLEAADQYYLASERIVKSLTPFRELDLADIAFQRAWLYGEHHRRDQAHALFAEALRLRQHHLPADHYLVNLCRLGTELTSVEREPDLQGALRMLSTGVPDERVRRLTSLALQMMHARALRRESEASDIYRQLVAEVREAIGAESPIYCLVLGDYASQLYRQGNYREAFVAIQEALGSAERIAPNHRRYMLASLVVAEELGMARQFELAERYYARAFTIGIESSHQLRQATLLRAEFLVAAQRPQEAQRVLDSLQPDVESFPSEGKLWLLRIERDIARSVGDEAKASARQVEMGQILETMSPDDADFSALTLARLATLYAEANQTARAEKLMRRALSIERKTRVARHPRIADRADALARLLVQQANWEEAAPLAREAAEIRREQLPTDDPRTVESVQLVETIRARQE